MDPVYGLGVPPRDRAANSGSIATRARVAAVYLLNPHATATDGEWEALFFATWSPELQQSRQSRR
jgi:hypothetical protein